jgi:hypothetical protein
MSELVNRYERGMRAIIKTVKATTTSMSVNPESPYPPERATGWRDTARRVSQRWDDLDL